MQRKDDYAGHLLEIVIQLLVSYSKHIALKM